MRLWEPAGSPCCPHNPSSDATEAADHSTPHPRGCHKHGTLGCQGSTAGCPRHKEFRLPTQPAGRGDGHTFPFVPWEVQEHALLFQDMYASPRQAVNVLVCLPSAESTPSSRRISLASDRCWGDPNTPHHPGPAVAGDLLKNSSVASVTCRPRIENQQDEGSGHGLCLTEPAEITLEHSMFI